MSDVVLQMTDVAYAHGRTDALRGVSLNVGTGEVVAVTGPSGSGKSTLLHVGAGILAARSGAVRLLGQDLAAASDDDRTRMRRRGVGVVLQFGHLVPDLSALDNVALPLLLDGHDPASARASAAEWLAAAGVAEQAAAVPSQLSGGQSQRVAVARALVTAPSIVFADEPTGALDRAGGDALLRLLLDAARDRDAAVVLVTHDNTVASRADREIRLRDGLVEYEAELR